MGRYKRKDLFVSARQWFPGEANPLVVWTGRLQCGCTYAGEAIHGGIEGCYESFEDTEIPPHGFRVCPGDWIVTAEDGRVAVYSDKRFAAVFCSLECEGDLMSTEREALFAERARIEEKLIASSPVPVGTKVEIEAFGVRYVGFVVKIYWAAGKLRYSVAKSAEDWSAPTDNLPLFTGLDENNLAAISN